MLSLAGWVWLVAATLAGAPATPTVASFAEPGARCVPASICIPIALHVTVAERRPVRDPKWFAAQLRDVNRLFGSVGVSFEVASVELKTDEGAEVVTRLDRDRLGRADHTLGPVHVYLVAKLGDVDRPGEEIRGVHWRDRSDTRRRWIILSAIAPDLVLAHEMGHFFGLPHSGDARSLMNKRPGNPIPWSERGFVAAEVERMRSRRRSMLRDGTLRPWTEGSVGGQTLTEED